MRPASYTLAAFGEGKVPDIGKNVEVVDKDVKDVVIELENGVTLTGRVEPPAAGVDRRCGSTARSGSRTCSRWRRSLMVRASADAATGAFKLEHVPAGKLRDHRRHRGRLRRQDAGRGRRRRLRRTSSSRSRRARRSAARSSTRTARPRPARRSTRRSTTTRKRRSTSTARQRRATVGADGTFKIVGLEPGKYTVAAGWGWDDFAATAQQDDKKQPSS